MGGNVLLAKECITISSLYLSKALIQVIEIRDFNNFKPQLFKGKFLIRIYTIGLSDCINLIRIVRWSLSVG